MFGQKREYGKWLKNAYLYLVIIAVSAQYLNAQAFDEAFAKQLQRSMDSAYAKSKAIGVSVALIMPDGKMWQGVCGISAKGVPITKNMLFDIGSAQKNLEAALVLKLVEEGVLSLNDKIEKWLPVYPNINPNITIRQLLNQTDGVDGFVEDQNSPWRVGYKNIDFTKKWTPDEIISTFVGKPLFEPGKGWAYSQTNYILLRMIIEKATQSKIYIELEKRVLKPYKMNYTTPYMLNPIPDSLVFAHGWLDDDNNGEADDISEYSRNWIATLVPMLTYSTPADMAKWFHLLLHEKGILKKEFLDEMLTFQKTTPEEPLINGYGLGIANFNLGIINAKWANVVTLGHSGNQYGFMSFNFYFPEYKFTLSAMLNRGCDGDAGMAFTAVLNPLLDLILKKFGAKEAEDKSLLALKLKELKQTPDNIKLLFETAKMLQKKSEENESALMYEKIVNLDPNGKSEYYLESLLWKSIYDGLIKLKPEGIIAFIEKHSDYKDLKPAYKSLIKTYYKKGEVQNAITTAEKAFQFFNGDAASLNNLGWWIYESKYKDIYKQAIDYVIKATEMKPEDFNIWDTLGWLYLQNGDKQKAIYAEEQALKLAPQNEEFKRNLLKFKQ